MIVAGMIIIKNTSQATQKPQPKLKPSVKVKDFCSSLFLPVIERILLTS